MKKLILLFTFLLLTQNVYAGNSIFSKKETVETDKTQPFFINIYSDNGYEVSEDFDSPVLATNQQIHFFNKKFEQELNNNSDDNFFVTARRTTDINLSKSQTEKVELMSNYRYKKWDLSGGVSQETTSGKNIYSNYISFEPAYRFNDRITFFGGMSHSLTDNYEQTSLGIKYSPLKFDRLEFKFKVSNYTKQYSSYRNKFNFETIFKI